MIPIPVSKRESKYLSDLVKKHEDERLSNETNANLLGDIDLSELNTENKEKGRHPRLVDFSKSNNEKQVKKLEIDNTLDISEMHYHVEKAQNKNTNPLPSEKN